MRTFSQDEARRIGSELKRWSQRPISGANARALALCAVFAALMVLGTQDLTVPAASVRKLAAVSAVMLASVHYIWLAILRGLLRAGIVEAQDAINAMRDPRRISAFDMAMTWLLVSAVARYCE